MTSELEIKESDMEESLENSILTMVKEAQSLYNIDKDVATWVKEELDKNWGPAWHVICGRSFGSRVSYEMGHFLLLKCNKINMMIFKCGY